MFAQFINGNTFEVYAGEDQDSEFMFGVYSDDVQTLFRLFWLFSSLP